MRKGISWLLTLALIVSMMAVSGLSVSAATFDKGDVNGDGVVTTADVRHMLSMLTREEAFLGAQSDAADINGNVVVNTVDARQLLRQTVNELGLPTTISLLAPREDMWVNPVRTAWGMKCVVGETKLANGGTVFTNYGDGWTWPFTVHTYEQKIWLPEDAVIEYDITVQNGATSIDLYADSTVSSVFADAQPDGRAGCRLNSYISENVDAGSGDLPSGTYKGTIPVSSLTIADTYRENGMIRLGAIKIYTVGNNKSTVTINKLTVSAICEPLAAKVSTDPYKALRPTLFDKTEVAGLSSLTGMELYADGERSAATSVNTAADNKKLYQTAYEQRVVNYPDGYQVDIPADWKPDFTLAELRTRYTSSDYSLTITKEDKNPYKGADGWNTYLTEWLNRYIASNSFLSANGMTYRRSPATITDLLSGYTILVYDIALRDKTGIAMPYYSIAIIRKTLDYKNFHLMVLKSAAPTEPVMDRLLASFTPITPQGKAVNTQQQYEQILPANWTEETKAYYNKLCTQDTTDFGFFTHSMVPTNDSNYQNQYRKIQSEYTRLKTAMDFKYDIMPTYTHLSWYGSYNDFPLDMANAFAGGNGFNGKPVLQFTYQFTNNNNSDMYAKNPMFDILRGTHDAQFRKIARDIKTYGKPVLFRLNNEMNTDWTSYSGMVTLLDPDIFVQTWQRLYNIFKQEGVNNCIWIFNPIAATTPYCNWGEHLCFMPGAEYVQALGLTSYEMGNEATLRSFRSHYLETYEKNVVNFDNLPWIISEFAAGAGGEKIFDWSTKSYQNTVRGRNEAKQAEWVKEMFEELSNPNNAYCNKIKGAVWFSTNDSVNIDGTYYVVNFLALESSLDQTLAAFKEGFASRGK